MELLDELSKKMLLQEENRSLDVEKTENVFSKYEEYLKMESSFPILFQSKGENNSLSSCIDGVYVVLTEEEFRGTFGIVSGRNSAVISLLSTPVLVKVQRIERETNTVYVCFDKSDETKKLIPSERSRVESVISRKVYNKENVRVVGRIIKVDDTRALVNILDLNILGVLYVSEWADCYIRSLKDVCKEGEIYQFDIDRPQPKRDSGQRAWHVTRKAITGDLWESVNFTGLNVGDSLVVECVDKPVGKTYWWGKSSRLPGVAIMCDYTERYNSVSGIVKGLSYICKINLLAVDVENKKDRKIRVSPYTVINEDIERLEKFQALRNPIKG